MTDNQPKSSHGGFRPGAGRRKGSVNKVTADVREAAQQYSDEALAVLAEIMKMGDSASARVAAANSILDRAHGKPRQSVEVDADVTATIRKIERELVRPSHTHG